MTKHPATVAFTVKWDTRRRTFVALDEGGNLLGIGQNKNRTIGSAFRDATARSKAGVRVVVKVEGETGKYKTERVVEPP